MSPIPSLEAPQAEPTGIDADIEADIDLADFEQLILLSPTELVRALAEHERRAAVLALAVSHVSRAGRWADDGSVTMRAFLRSNCRMSDLEANAWLRRGRLLDRCEEFAKAALAGRLSSSQLRELERLHRPKYERLLREHQSMLAEQLSPLDAEAAAIACTLWRQRADAVLDEHEPPLEPRRILTISRAADGVALGRFTLDDASATELEKALGTARIWEGSDDVRTLAERNADALFDIAAFFNKNHAGDGTPRHLPHVSLSIEASSLGGTPEAINDDEHRVVSPSCADAHLCDCTLHTVLRGPTGAPLGFGRSRYVVPRSLFRQVAARDGGCRFPGCTRPVRFCDAHHIRFWRHGGTTDYGNLVLLCSRHHHLVHQQQLELTLEPDAALQVEWRTGRIRRSQARGAPPRASAA